MRTPNEIIFQIKVAGTLDFIIAFLLVKLILLIKWMVYSDISEWLMFCARMGIESIV